MTKIAIASLLVALLSGCASIPSREPQRRVFADMDARHCARSPYCGTYRPAGKPQDQIDVDLHQVREAVRRAQED